MNIFAHLRVGAPSTGRSVGGPGILPEGVDLLQEVGGDFVDISMGNTFVADFKQLLSKYPSVRTRLLGFPHNWEQEPLWR